MRFPSFWEFKRRFFSRVLKVPSDIVKSEFMLEPGKRRFFSRVLKVPSDIVKSEFMLEPGIITCELPDCNTVDKIGI